MIGKNIYANIFGISQKRRWSKSRHREEKINHIMSESRKLAKKEYKTRHDWVGEVIHWILG